MKRQNNRRFKKESDSVSKTHSVSIEEPDMVNFCEYNPEISKKFYKFIETLLYYDIEIVEENNRIAIYLNGSNTLNNSIISNTSNTSNKNYNKSYATNYAIYITKLDFKISRDHLDICSYKDTFVLNFFKEKIKIAHERNNESRFHSFIKEIVDNIPALNRQFKLDEIING